MWLITCDLGAAAETAARVGDDTEAEVPFPFGGHDKLFPFSGSWSIQHLELDI